MTATLPGASALLGVYSRVGRALTEALESGLIHVSNLYRSVLRLIPPLTITTDELGRGLAVVEEVLG